MGRFSISPASQPGRFSVGRFYVPPEEEPWQATASPLVQRRKRPDGTWETRPTPRAEGVPAVTKPPDPLEGQHPLKVFGEGVLDQVEQGFTSLARLPDLLINSTAQAQPHMALKPKDELYRPGSILPEIVQDTFANSDEEVEAGLQARLESQAARGRSPGSMLANEALITGASFVADPLNVPIGKSAKALGLLGRRGVGATDEAAEALARSIPPPAVAAPRPESVLQDVQPDRRTNLGFREEVDNVIAALRLEQPDAARLADIQARAEIEGNRAVELATERYAFERGRGFFGPGEAPEPTRAPEPLAPARGGESAAPAGAGGVPPPVNGGEALLPPPRPGAARGMRPPQGGLPGIEAPPSSLGRMSTKGVENVAGMQDELADVVRTNRGEIYAARGGPVPVSRWHEAEGLARKTGLTPDDYLKMPPGRTLNPDEGALGKHYLGGMKQQARELEQRLASGEVEDIAAAVAEKDARNRDVVRMMAVLQAQGSSEFGRYGRMLQEALDPYQLAETPKERLQLALLKHYGAKNADEAAAIEQKAVARIQRQAAREARKAKRTATAQELSDEFGSLLGELDSLTKRPRGMGGGVVPLDPELVGVIGKMAANRVRAGVVAVEELADAVYVAVRDRVEGISREQVKAAIVEHALARPAKLTREEARVRQAEAAARKSIEKMEASVAAGGAKAPRPAPVSSPALEKLRARQAELREQLAALRGKPAADPAVRRLTAAEALAERRVKKLEEKLAAGPRMPTTEPAPAASERLSTLRQRAADLRSQIEKDPRHSLIQRYRELLDEDTVEMISKLPDPAEDPDALLQFLRRMETPTWKDYMGAFVYNNLLSGPKSLEKNVVGNTVKRWFRVIERPLAAGFEHVLARQQGRLPERYVREVVPMVVGSYAGAPEALKKALWVLKEGWDPERVVGELTGVKGNSKYYEGRLPVDPFLLSESKLVRGIGAVHGYGPRLMQVGDVMARSRNFTSASYAWATRQAINDVKRGVASDVSTRAAELLKEQPDAMLQYAQRVAREDTFQDEVSNMARVVGMVRREDSALGFALSQVVRFLNVPDRIAAWLADYTPGLRLAGAAWKGGKLRKAWGTPEASDLLARQAFGTAVAAAAAAWAFEGKLAGPPPRDEKLRNDFYATGKQPWSVLIGGRWVPIRDVFGGWAAPVAAAAAFHDSAMTGEPVDSEEILRRSGGAALGEARYLLDANYLSNLSDVVAAISADPAQAGKQAVAVAANTAGGALVPWSGLQRNVAIARDPRVVEKEGFLDEIKAGIPGLRETLPSRYDADGRPLTQGTGAAGGLFPVVPTESKLAAPGLSEDVERLRYTVARRRTEINRTMDQIKEARKSKDATRVRELAAGLPGAADRVQGDAALARVRGMEQQLRKLRADEKVAPERKRSREIALQKQMLDILSKALQRMEKRP